MAVEASEPSGEGAVTDAVIVVGNVDNDQDDGSGGHFVHFVEFEILNWMRRLTKDWLSRPLSS